MSNIQAAGFPHIFHDLIDYFIDRPETSETLTLKESMQSSFFIMENQTTI